MRCLLSAIAGAGLVTLGYIYTAPDQLPAFKEPRCTVYVHRLALTRSQSR